MGKMIYKRVGLLTFKKILSNHQLRVTTPLIIRKLTKIIIVYQAIAEAIFRLI